MKKIWVSFLSIIAILSVWISFADILPNPSIPEEKCIMFDSVELENWRVVNFNLDWIYEEQANECVEYGIFYVLNYDNDIEDVTQENIEDRAEGIIMNRPSFTRIGVYPTRHEYIYKIVVNGSGSYEAKLIGENEITLREEDSNYIEKDDTINNEIKNTETIIVDFTSFIKNWVRTVFLETLLLFLIAKLCRKSWTIKNRKIIVTWILASTLTLPLLRFVLPMFFSNYWVYVIFWEIFVTVIEVFIIKYSLKIERKMAILASVACNLCSFLFWLIIF